MTDGPPRIFDRKAVALHRARGRRLAGNYHHLGVDALESIAGRLTPIKRDFNRVLDVEGFFRNARPFRYPRRHVDLGEMEILDVSEAPYDLVVSVLGLHAVNDLPGALAQIRRALRPDGIFVGALFGGETLTELRQSLAAAEIEILGGVSPRVAPFADIRDLGGLLQRAGFALPVADVERTVIRFSNFTALVRELRLMGETNALVERSRKPMRRDMLKAAMAHYAEHFADSDGKLRATFDIVYLTGWAPHESQQQPLRPGSAKARLADALGTREQSSGEKPEG
jgi:SAM-dependent methyltransferase